MSRGSTMSLGAVARRGFALFASALLMAMLLTQYIALVSPTKTLAMNSSTGSLELDGNVANNGRDDWTNVKAGNSSAFATTFITDGFNGGGDKYFTGGSSKDTSDISNWLWTTVSQPQDKTDIEHAYAAAYHENGHLVVYFGLDRYASNGDAQTGFWFTKGAVGLTGGPSTGGFSGTHQNGDVLVQIDYQNGGTTPVVRVYEWNNGLTLVSSTGGSCAVAPANANDCAISNTASVTPTWSFTDKMGGGTATDPFPAGGFVEGGIDLTGLGLDQGCFASFVAETRSTHTYNSTLSDFVTGSFPLCSTPDINTQVKQNGQSTSSINMGESFTDHAALTGSSGTVTGTVDFFLCGPTGAAADCASGGTKVGATKTLESGAADSDPVTPTQEGWYCFRAEYTPAAGSKYLGTTHTNHSTECVQVLPAHVTITKTAAAAHVSAGDPIGFTLSWGNSGAGVATGVAVSDPLPGTAGLHWTITGSTGTGSTCAITGADGSQVLNCAVGTVPGKTDVSGTVTVGSPTTKAVCGAVNNTGTVTSTNDGTANDPATTTVDCPVITITKTADKATVSAGQQIGFTVTVGNSGPGTAKSVTLADPLPGGTANAWTINPAYTTPGTCAITGALGSQTLNCSFGDMAPGASASVHIIASTSYALCGTYDNTGTASASNAASVHDSASITCQKPALTITKTADSGSVNAGDAIGFTIVVGNTGPGTALGVSLHDPLPAGSGTGVTWAISPSVAGCSIASGTLDCTIGTMAAGASFTVHISATTSYAECTKYDNTATASATNAPSVNGRDVITCGTPALTITKTADADTVSAGEAIGFTVTVGNSGPGLAKNVTLNDPLPAGVTWSISPAYSGPGTCSVTGAAGSQTLACSFGNLDAKASASVHISAQTSYAACSQYDNTGTASADNAPSKDASASILCQKPALTITKTADAAKVDAGDPIGFTVTFGNTGPGVAKNVTLADPLPAGVTWSIDGGTAAAKCSISVANELDCSVGNMAAGASYTVHITAQTSGEACGTYDNTGTVSADNAPSKDASASIVCQAPKLTISKTADATSVNAGATIGFTVTVGNDGPGAAKAVKLSDPLPAGVTWSVSPAYSGPGTCAVTGAADAQSLDCSFGDMAAAASASVHISATTSYAACSQYDNTGTASASNAASVDASASITCVAPNLTITKTADAAKVNAGDAIGFTVTVANSGPGLAKNVKLSDPLPAGSGTGVTWAISPAYNGPGTCAVTGAPGAQSLDCSFGDMATAASASVHISATTSYAECTKYDNTGTASADNAPSKDASASIACDKPALTITKTADAATVDAGDPIGFTVTVGNSGPGIARSVQLSDPLPAGVTWSLSTYSGPGTCAVTGAPGAQSLDCSFGDMASGDSIDVHVSAATTYQACATYNNTATASATNAPSVDASASITCQKPNLTILKSADAATVNAGDPIGFTVTVGNSGAGLAKSVQLSDPLPGGVTWAIDGGTNTAACSISGGTLNCSIGDMKTDDVFTVHVTATTSAQACAKYDNTATASATNAPSVDASASILCQAPDVTVVKTADKTPISAGDTAGFTMLVTNNGPGTAYNVTLNDPLPANVSWSTSTPNCQIANGVLSCAWSSLAVGSESALTVHVTGKASAAACGNLPNTATVGASNEPVANQGNNKSSASITVICPPVSIVKVADDASVSAGDQVGFTITVSNNSAFTALNVTVDDVLPTNGGLGWSISGAANGFSISGGHLVHAAMTMAAHASLSVHIVSGTSSATCGTVDNTATLSYNGGSGSSSDSVTVNCPDVTIRKTANNSPILAGQTASYTLTVTNLGPGTAYGVTVHDPLPAGTTWTSNSAKCSVSGGALTCNVGTLAKGATFSVTVSGTTTVAQCGQLPNTATVAATNEPSSNTGNNSSSASITVQCASISLVKTAGDAADGTTLVVQQPGTVVFTYVVTNTGTAALQGVALVDDNGTPSNTADDVKVVCPKTTLAAGESMTCHATLPVTFGTRTNIAKVVAHPVLAPSGTVSATDDAVVFVPQPEITPTPTPKLTLPPTSTVDGTGTGGQAGNGLLLVLVAVAGLMLVAGLLAPAPARARRRNRRG